MKPNGHFLLVTERLPQMDGAPRQSRCADCITSASHSMEFVLFSASGGEGQSQRQREKGRERENESKKEEGNREGR